MLPYDASCEDIAVNKERRMTDMKDQALPVLGVRS